VAEPFVVTNLGRYSDPEPYEVSAEAIAAYARATNDSAEDALAGDVAPTVFAIVPVFGRSNGPSVVEAGQAAALRGRVVHGEQWMVVHRPIVAGDRLWVRAATIGIHAKSSGVQVVSRTETTGSSGEPVNEQYVTIFYRGVASGVDTGEVAPSLKALRGDEEGEALPPVTCVVDADQPVRYAEASGDHNRIHLDDEFARSVGLPGIIVHGMCTLAFAARAVREAMGTSSAGAIRQLGARFTSPLLPGDRLTTKVARLSSQGDGLRAVRFSCDNGAGQAVLGAGYAELAEPASSRVSALAGST
jgi:acyl dehydratase